MKKNKINKELEELSSFLSNMKKNKTDETSVPANYFDKFEARLIHRIKEEEALSTIPHLDEKITIHFFSKIKAFFKPYYAIGFSTCLLLIIGSIYVLKPVDNTTNSDTMEGLLADGSIDIYIDDHIEEFNTEDIVALLEVNEVVDIQSNMIGEELLNSNDIIIENKTERIKASMDKALDVVGIDDLLEDLTEADLELSEDDLF